MQEQEDGNKGGCKMYIIHALNTNTGIRSGIGHIPG